MCSTARGRGCSEGELLTLDPDAPDPVLLEPGVDSGLLEEWDEARFWADLAASDVAADASVTPAGVAASVGWGESVGAWQRLARVLPVEEDPHDPATLDRLADEVLLDRMAHAEALTTQLAAAQARALGVLRGRRLAEQAAVHGHPVVECPASACCDPDGWVGPEAAPRLGLSDRQVGSRLDTADRAGRYRAVAAAMTDGRLQAFTAFNLLEHLDTLSTLVDAPQLANAEAGALAWLLAGPRTVAQLNARMRRLILVARAGARSDDPSGDPPPGQADRHVTVSPASSPGLAEVVALLPEADALAVRATLAALGRGRVDPADLRTAQQRRADLLVTMVTGSPAVHGRAADTGYALHDPVPIQVHLDLTLPADRLRATSAGPCRIPGYGDIPAATSHDLISATTGCTARPVIYDPVTGRLTGFAPTPSPVPITWLADLRPGRGYQHPATLDTATRLRDRTCRAPVCTRPASDCDCDHVVPWPEGPTSLANTCCLCRRHHRLKTHAPGWHLSIDPEGDATWTTPTGTRHTTQPADHRPPDLPGDPGMATPAEPDSPPF
jgi:hypothetical protein